MIRHGPSCGASECNVLVSRANFAQRFCEVHGPRGVARGGQQTPQPPNPARWVWIARTLPQLQQLHQRVDDLLGIARADVGLTHTRPNDRKELAAWRARLRASGALDTAARSDPMGVDGRVLPRQALQLEIEGRKRRNACLDEMVKGNVVNARGAPMPVALTKQPSWWAGSQKEAAFADEAKLKAPVLRSILVDLCAKLGVAVPKGLKSKVGVAKALAAVHKQAAAAAAASKLGDG
jgi:hypothetical protein